MQEGRGKRKGLRVPANFDVRCDLTDGSSLKAKIVNLGTEGVLIKSAEPLSPGDRLTMEFLLPGTLSSLQLVGEVMYARAGENEQEQVENAHMAGIEFADLKEPYLGIIREYTLKMLNNEDLLRDGGILLVMDDLRSLPPEYRLRAYNILIKKSSGHVL